MRNLSRGMNEMKNRFKVEKNKRQRREKQRREKENEEEEKVNGDKENHRTAREDEKLGYVKKEKKMCEKQKKKKRTSKKERNIRKLSQKRRMQYSKIYVYLVTCNLTISPKNLNNLVKMSGIHNIKVKIGNVVFKCHKMIVEKTNSLSSLNRKQVYSILH